MGPDHPENFMKTLKNEVEAGRVPISRIDDAVRRILNAKRALNLWDNPYADRKYLPSVGCQAHRDLAREAAAKSMVLLENRMPVDEFPLPLRGSYTVVVAGTSANNLGKQCGGWTISWQGASGATTIGTTIFQGIKNTLIAENAPHIKVDYIDSSWGSHESADIGIIVIGEIPYAEGIGDSDCLAIKEEDVCAIDEVSLKVKKCIVVILSGRPLIITEHLHKADVWISGWLPGSEGQAVADVLFGVRPFRGKLPVSWPRSVEQEPINFDDGTDVEELYKIGHGMTIKNQVW